MTENSENQSDTSITIALDAMGGDHAPACIMEGAALALKKTPNIRFVLHGDEEAITPWLEKLPALKQASTIEHTDITVSGDAKPSTALRTGRNSSMGRAIKTVRQNEVDCAVSAGNTGVLMGLSKLMLRTLPGIDRPAIVSLLPTLKGNCVMLDLGANVYCDANNLFEFAVMGDAFARIMLGLDSPSIGLLNIGSEEGKGNDIIREAATMLRECEMQLNYYGHIEGDDIGHGAVDVVVTDGFSGNIALKTAEGTAKMAFSFIKEALQQSLIARLGAFLARPALRSVVGKLDPRLHNGAMFLGLNGIVVKSHGGTDAVGFANAIAVAIRLASADINTQIVNEMIQSGHIMAEETTKPSIKTPSTKTTPEECPTEDKPS